MAIRFILSIEANIQQKRMRQIAKSDACPLFLARVVTLSCLPL